MLASCMLDGVPSAVSPKLNARIPPSPLASLRRIEGHRKRHCQTRKPCQQVQEGTGPSTLRRGHVHRRRLSLLWFMPVSLPDCAWTTPHTRVFAIHSMRRPTVAPGFRPSTKCLNETLLHLGLLGGWVSACAIDRIHGLSPGLPKEFPLHEWQLQVQYRFSCQFILHSYSTLIARVA